MTKLWDKGYTLDQVVENFMTGDDPQLDLRIAKYDCLASIAHAKMLQSIHILSHDECRQLTNGLEEIITLIERNAFKIENSQEDIHTAIENYLVEKYGDIGKKIHTARSRNDQALTALRLYMRQEIADVFRKAVHLAEIFYTFAKANEFVPYVGRTHYQKAMPASIGLWMGAFIESLLDDLKVLENSYHIVNQCPLGSAASYGVSLPIDRELTSKLLGFEKVQNNVLYANNSRGKFESIVISALNQIMMDMAKLATDIILFSAAEMGYLNLPLEFCPGSSIMPNKRNPDPFELIRAKSATVMGYLFQSLEVIRALPSGYNRDFQESKRPLFFSFDIVKQTLDVLAIIIAKVTVNEEACLLGFTNEVFATDYALHLAAQGMPFRDAYQTVAQGLAAVKLNDPLTNILGKTHVGATGNLQLNQIYKHIKHLKTHPLYSEELL